MSNHSEDQSFVIRDEKYDSPDYPSWLCEEGRILYDSNLSFHINCINYGHDSAWRRRLNKEAARVIGREF